ncbi:hypothetical protein JANAI62_04970 [Jannaschia pagri]|uniref:Uncharacterized protein n=1 Tax=Jannaschia pagri TaxID=2829797 RepID=A0ABQ4NHG4_9RHOB|nr:hypothetical protein JANAI61_04780 [Jannaschia sp. AI_61]GIT93874.1 hypothetical protein JANAI62_04970 [Jannaschia sp. AI_62]
MFRPSQEVFRGEADHSAALVAMGASRFGEGARPRQTEVIDSRTASSWPVSGNGCRLVADAGLEHCRLIATAALRNSFADVFEIHRSRLFDRTPAKIAAKRPLAIVLLGSNQTSADLAVALDRRSHGSAPRGNPDPCLSSNGRRTVGDGNVLAAVFHRLQAIRKTIQGGGTDAPAGTHSNAPFQHRLMAVGS